MCDLENVKTCPFNRHKSLWATGFRPVAGAPKGGPQSTHPIQQQQQQQQQQSKQFGAGGSVTPRASNMERLNALAQPKQRPGVAPAPRFVRVCS
jgi:hypothetical protein